MLIFFGLPKTLLISAERPLFFLVFLGAELPSSDKRNLEAGRLSNRGEAGPSIERGAGAKLADWRRRGGTKRFADSE